MSILCFADTETTGLHEEREPWEVALIRRENGVDSEVSFFLDVNTDRADPQALDIGGFHERHPYGRALRYGEPIAPGSLLSSPEAAEQVSRFTAGAVLLVNNPCFDVPLLQLILARAWIKPAWHYRPIDLIAWAAGFLDGHHTPSSVTDLPWRSEDVSRALGVAPPTGALRHTALGDTYWMRDLYDRITGVDA